MGLEAASCDPDAAYEPNESQLHRAGLYLDLGDGVFKMKPFSFFTCGASYFRFL